MRKSACQINPSEDILAGILDFCQAAYSEGENLMAVFQVHCDESGKLADSACVVFASCVFPQDEVAAFQRKWKELLKDAGISYLHTREAMRLEGEFRDWKARSNDRDALLETLAQLLLDRSAFLTTSPMDTATFRELAQGDQQRLKTPTYAGFDGLLVGLLADAARNHKSEHRFHMIYDLSEEYSRECLKLFNKLRVMRQAYRQFFPSLTFADDQQFAPLQGADLLAYCRKEKFINGENPSHCEPIIQNLLQIFDSIHTTTRSVAYPQGASLGDAAFEIPE